MNTVVSLSQAMYGYLFGVIYEVGNSYMIFMISSLICLVGMFIILKTPYFNEKVEK